MKGEFILGISPLVKGAQTTLSAKITVGIAKTTIIAIGKDVRQDYPWGFIWKPRKQKLDIIATGIGDRYGN